MKSQRDRGWTRKTDGYPCRRDVVRPAWKVPPGLGIYKDTVFLMGTRARRRPWWAELQGAGKVEAASAGKASGAWERRRGEVKWYLEGCWDEASSLGCRVKECEPISGHREGGAGMRGSGCWETTGNIVGGLGDCNLFP